MTTPDDPRELYEREIARLNGERRQMVEDLTELDAALNGLWY